MFVSLISLLIDPCVQHAYQHTRTTPIMLPRQKRLIKLNLFNFTPVYLINMYTTSTNQPHHRAKYLYQSQTKEML